MYSNYCGLFELFPMLTYVHVHCFFVQSFPQAPTLLPYIQPFVLLPVPFPLLPSFPLPSPLSTFTPYSSSPPNLSSLSVCLVSDMKLTKSFTYMYSQYLNV